MQMNENFPLWPQLRPFCDYHQSAKKWKIDVILLHLFTLLDRYPCTGDAETWSKQTNALLNGNRNLISPKSMMFMVLFGEVSLARPCMSHTVSRYLTQISVNNRISVRRCFLKRLCVFCHILSSCFDPITPVTAGFVNKATNISLFIFNELVNAFCCCYFKIVVYWHLWNGIPLFYLNSKLLNV